jgi:diacylglycerol O-acyltransferase
VTTLLPGESTRHGPKDPSRNADRPYPCGRAATTLTRMVVDRLTAEDRLMLWSDASWPQDIGALAILDGRALLESDGRFRIEAARAAIASRLHRLPRSRQILDEPPRGLGRPLWIDATGFDLRHHVQVAQVPAPGDETQLLQTTERLRRCRLDRRRPLWEVWFLPGLPDGRVGMFIRLHHVIADGVALVAIGPGKQQL